MLLFSLPSGAIAAECHDSESVFSRKSVIKELIAWWTSGFLALDLRIVHMVSLVTTASRATSHTVV